MLRYVGREAYTTYEQQHVKRVMVPAVVILSVELFSGFYLAFLPTQRLPSLPIHIALVLLLPIWLSTWYAASVCVSHAVMRARVCMRGCASVVPWWRGRYQLTMVCRLW
jgi:hypothetical protein